MSDYRNNFERTSTMITWGGTLFDLRSPRPEDIDLDDVAHAMSRYCRYGGHLCYHYSVAEHCQHVAAWLLADGAPLNHVAWGLLHDADEAYYGDVIGPLKHAPELAGYRELVGRFTKDALVPRFALDPPNEPREVKLIDDALLVVEMAILRNIVDNEERHGVRYELLPIAPKQRALRQSVDWWTTSFWLTQVHADGVQAHSSPVTLAGHHADWTRPNGAWVPDGLFTQDARVAKSRWLSMARDLGLRDLKDAKEVADSAREEKR